MKRLAAVVLLTGCTQPYIELGISKELDGSAMDDTLAQVAIGNEWIYEAQYRKMIFDLRYQHKSDPSRKDIGNGLDEIELNTRFYLY